MTAAESSGSAHSSPGHQWMPFAGSDSDHPEPTHPPTHVHPAHRWTTYLRPGCRRDAGLIKFIGAEFATAVWLIFTNQIIHEETTVNEEYISDFTKRPLRWENYLAQVCFVKDIICNIFALSCLKRLDFFYIIYWVVLNVSNNIQFIYVPCRQTFMLLNRSTKLWDKFVRRKGVIFLCIGNNIIRMAWRH